MKSKLNNLGESSEENSTRGFCEAGREETREGMHRDVKGINENLGRVPILSFIILHVRKCFHLNSGITCTPTF